MRENASVWVRASCRHAPASLPLNQLLHVIRVVMMVMVVMVMGVVSLRLRRERCCETENENDSEQKLFHTP